MTRLIILIFCIFINQNIYSYDFTDSEDLEQHEFHLFLRKEDSYKADDELLNTIKYIENLEKTPNKIDKVYEKNKEIIHDIELKLGDKQFSLNELSKQKNIDVIHEIQKVNSAKIEEIKYHIDIINNHIESIEKQSKDIEKVNIQDIKKQSNKVQILWRINSRHEIHIDIYKLRSMLGTLNAVLAKYINLHNASATQLLNIQSN